jgi:large subunit ribosomal protein L3
MGHRKVHAPRRGSLAYLPRGRASRWLGHVRCWPTGIQDTKPLAFVGYKAGMRTAVGVDNREGSLTFGKEIAFPITIVEAPPMIAVAFRAYTKTPNGLQTFAEAWMEKPPKDLMRLLSLPESINHAEKIAKMESSLDKIGEVRVLLASQPRVARIGRKTPELLEVKLGGKTPKEQFEYARNQLGKEIKVSDTFKEGDWVDVIGITKGKGIQGPVKRFGIRRKFHKARKTVRAVGSIGGWTPHYVMYSVPRPGQMGFNQRTEYNKLVVKIGQEGKEVTPKGGFHRYGEIKAQYVMLKGTVPGPAKRTVTLRHGVRGEATTIPPKLDYLSLESPQGS